MPPAGWFLDADMLNLHETLYYARRKNYNDVYSAKTEGFPVRQGMLDVVWMPLLKGCDFAVITKDGQHRHRKAERQAIIDNQLGEFALRSAANLNTWQMMRLLLARWDEMEERWDSTQRSFVFTVPRFGPLLRKR